MSNDTEGMEFYIPTDPARIDISNDPSNRDPEDQKNQIVAFAKQLRHDQDLNRYVIVEVHYFFPGHSVPDQSETFDALQVDTDLGEIIGTVPPYKEIEEALNA